MRRNRATVGDVRRVIREEIARHEKRPLREWLDVPSDWDQFLQQNKVAVKDLMAGVRRVVGSYEASAEATDANQNQQLTSQLTQLLMQALYKGMQQDVFSKGQQQAPAQQDQQKKAS